MEALLLWVEASAFARWAGTARWGYAALNAAHIFAVALLVGAMVPLNLRRIGLFAAVPQEALARVLVPMAVAGLTLALLTGAALFAPRASEYAGLGIVQLKLALIAIGAATALTLHAVYGFTMVRASPRRRALHAVPSLVLWIAVLACGRLIAFAD